MKPSQQSKSATMTEANAPIIWIDWGQKLRTRTLATRLGVKLVEIISTRSGFARYIACITRTLAMLRHANARVVIATNPSFVLGILLLFLRRWYNYALVSDAHYIGVRAIQGSGIPQRLLDAFNARADLVIVTNDGHAQHITDLGGRSYVCPDPLPTLPARRSLITAPPQKSVFLICSFFQDEPYELVFNAFSHLQRSGYELFVSGDYRKALVAPSAYPWVHFLGFVPEHEYYEYLRSCALVLDLTTLEDCLVCGAYEALAAGQPLVLSNTQALSEYFGAAVVLTDNNCEAIVRSVKLAYAQREVLAQRAASWTVANERYMDDRISGLKKELGVRRDAVISNGRKPAST